MESPEKSTSDEPSWLPILRRLKSGEETPLPEVARKPGAFPTGEFVVIAGPCAVDDHLEETLGAVADLGITWVRGGAWKPRTFPWSFQGHGLEGLRRMRGVADRRGLRVVSEI